MLGNKWCTNKNEQCIKRAVNEISETQMPLAVLECGHYKIINSSSIEKKANDFSVIEYIEGGEATVKIGKLTYNVTKGDLYCIERGTGFSITPLNNTDVKIGYVLFNGTLFKNLIFSYNVKNTVMFKNYNDSSFLKNLFDLNNEGNSKTDIFYQSCRIFSEIAFNIFSKCNELSDVLSAEKILLLINNNVYKKGFKLEDIADMLNISKAYLISIFKEAYGITPYKYFINLKINAATELLMDKSKSISEISEYLNFADQHYFSDVFKKSIGMTPSDYRRTYSVSEYKNDLTRNINVTNRLVNIEKYIKQTWNKCIINQTYDDGGTIGLPYPYIVPSPDHRFRNLYYWHIYFTNLGLISDGLLMQAKYNVSNIQFLIERYGYMPNGNSEIYLTRSQPPLFTRMIRDIYKSTGDLYWLRRMYKTAVKEYEWWQTNRNTSIGLNQYGTDMTAEHSEYESMYNFYFKRTDTKPTSNNVDDIVKLFGTFCESGWDCNPRIGEDYNAYAWVDLNSLLFIYETDFMYFANQLNNGEAEKWRKIRYERREKMNRYMWNGKFYTDYNLKDGKNSEIISCANFYPLFAGVASKEQAHKIRGLLEYLEYPHGVVACAKGDRNACYQWDYPNAWAPLQYIVVEGLLFYAFFDDALRIAKKFVNTVEKNYIATGKLWQKYNAVSGGIDTKNENREMIEMHGWTAGVYLRFKEIIKNYESDKKSNK